MIKKRILNDAGRERIGLLFGVWVKTVGLSG